MESLTCPRCGADLHPRSVGDGEVSVCPEGHGVFLERAELGALIQAESDWHRHAGQHTAPMPRITADMEPPPVTKLPAQAWVETLFT